MSDRCKEALFYKKLEDNKTACLLCPHCCVIPDEQAGFCRARVNENGKLYAKTYGLISSCALDPIEKKPLYRFFPGSYIYSIGSHGCNLRCPFCQNHAISMDIPTIPIEGRIFTPEQIAILAIRQTYGSRGNIGIAYTYNEPLIGYEFVMDTAIFAREKDLKNVLVTNGYIQPEPLRELLPYIDALNIDMKAYTEAFYKNVKGDMDTVKNTIAIAAGVAHVEVTTLVIPDENDGEAEIDALARFIADVDPDIPLHLTRFFPRYKMADKTPTPKETVLRLVSVAKHHLHYVYPGNMG